MHARSSGSASPGVRDRLRLEWEVGLQRLPFFTQRLAVALLGLLVVSLALVGGMVILWGGQQGSEVQLQPPPEAGQPGGRSSLEPLGPPTPVHGVGGEAANDPGGGGGDGTQAPVGAREASSSTGDRSARSGSTRRSGPAGQAPPTTTAPTTTAPTREPTTTDGGVLGPLPLPPVLSTLLS